MASRYTSETVKAYDTYSHTFAKKFRTYFKRYLKPEADEFLSLLAGKRIVDLGAGSGDHALYFKKQGGDVLCVDISDAMLELCKAKGLAVKKMNIEKLSFPKASFDGVWAYTSLLHIAKKNTPGVFRSVQKILTPNGIFAVAFIKGREEGFRESRKYPGVKRFFAYFTVPEFMRLAEPYFTLIEKKEHTVADSTFVNLLLRAK